MTTRVIVSSRSVTDGSFTVVNEGDIAATVQGAVDALSLSFRRVNGSYDPEHDRIFESTDSQPSTRALAGEFNQSRSGSSIDMVFFVADCPNEQQAEQLATILRDNLNNKLGDGMRIECGDVPKNDPIPAAP